MHVTLGREGLYEMGAKPFVSLIIYVLCGLLILLATDLKNRSPEIGGFVAIARK